MAWINVNDQLPEEGQEVYYFSPILGLWRGKYNYSPFTHSTWYDENNQPHTEPASESLRNAVNPHVFSCGGGGNCDTDEVTHWQPYDEKRAAVGWCPVPPNHGISDERMAEYQAWREPTDADIPKNRPAVEPQKLPPRPDTAWRDADELLVDPPSGWLYGFPKVWNKKTHPDMRAWLVENGYPEKAAKDENTTYRFMAVPEKTET